MNEQKIPQGYKNTEVGVIPEDWEIYHLKNLLKEPPKYGVNAPAVPLVGKLPVYIRITDISEDGYFSPSEKVGVKSPLSHLYILNDGDIVLARTGASVGKSYLYKKEDGILVYAGFLIKVSPDKERLDSKYLSQYLKTNKYWLWVAVNSMRSGQPGINSNEYGNLLIPLPNPREQTLIATALSDVDALICELEKLFAKKQAIKTATMQQLLTGKTRLPQFALHEDGTKKGYKQSELGEIPEDWEVEKLGQFVVFKNGVAHENCINEFGKYIVVNSKFISTEGAIGKYSSECRQPVYLSDVLMVMSDVPNGRAIAKCYWVEKNNFYTLNQRICSLQSVNVDSKYLFYKLDRNPFYLAFDDGAKQTNLRKQDVLDCPLAIPKSIQEQTAIATILSDMDSEIQTLEQRLVKTRQIKQGMMQELLTGKTRLVQPEA